MKKRISVFITVVIVGVIGCWINMPTEVNAYEKLDPELRDIRSYSLEFEETNLKNDEEKPFTIVRDKLPVNDKEYYYIYLEDSSGFSLYKFETDFIKIVKTDEVDPCIKGRFKPFTTYEEALNYMGIARKSEIKKYQKYTIYVPKNTKEVILKSY